MYDKESIDKMLATRARRAASDASDFIWQAAMNLARKELKAKGSAIEHADEIEDSDEFMLISMELARDFIDTFSQNYIIPIY
jgi:hypothetical protein